ncbi:MAG: hypothetical protein DWI58_17805 [Chloroflexi bacterium]|nr:MAG: hypothetical protein DWI58_17805 [Chloroflexota bacterium]
MPELDTDGAIRAFISDAHAIVAQHGGQVNDASLADIAHRMKEIARWKNLEALAEAARERGERLYSEPGGGFQLMLAHFPATTAVHTHGAWGVMAANKGKEWYRQYVREDDGSAEGEARLKLVREVRIEPGDIGWWYSPPDDIHQQVPDEGGASELIMMSEPPASERLYFDLDHHTYIRDTPAARHYPAR